MTTEVEGNKFPLGEKKVFAERKTDYKHATRCTCQRKHSFYNGPWASLLDKKSACTFSVMFPGPKLVGWKFFARVLWR
jgi:hypothetical protein